MREIIFLSEAKNKSAVDHGGKGNTGRGGANIIIHGNPKATDPKIKHGDYSPLQQLMHKDYQDFNEKRKQNGEETLSYEEWDATEDPAPTKNPESAVILYGKYKLAKKNGFKGSYTDWLPHYAKQYGKKKSKKK